MKRVVVLFVLAIGLASQASAQVGGRDTIASSPSAKFTPQDFEMMWAVIEEVSREKKKGLVKSWENTETGNGGSIKLLQSFKSEDGRDCRRLRVDNHAKKQKGASAMNVCADPQGKWLLDADARPAPKS